MENALLFSILIEDPAKWCLFLFIFTHKVLLVWEVAYGVGAGPQHPNVY